MNVFPQIAIAIGVLTSNRGGGDEPLWRIGRGTRVPLQGQRTRCHCRAIVGCHCSVLSLWGRVTTNWCHCWVPLQGAIVVCYGGGEGDRQLWRSGRGAIAGCHCCAMAGARVTANFGGVDVVPLQGAIVVCYGLGGG